MFFFQVPADNAETDLNIDEELENLILDENMENVSYTLLPSGTFKMLYMPLFKFFYLNCLFYIISNLQSLQDINIEEDLLSED